MIVIPDHGQFSRPAHVPWRRSPTSVADFSHNLKLRGEVMSMQWGYITK